MKVIMTEQNKRDEARSRLLQFIPRLKVAIALANEEVTEGGSVYLGIMAKNTDGSGKVWANFHSEDFIKDLVEALGYEGPEPTEQEIKVARLLANLRK